MKSFFRKIFKRKRDEITSIYYDPDKLWKDTHQRNEIVIIDRMGVENGKFKMDVRVWNGKEYERKESEFPLSLIL